MDPFRGNTGGGCSLGSPPRSRPDCTASRHCRESPPGPPTLHPTRAYATRAACHPLASWHCGPPAPLSSTCSSLQSFVRGPLSRPRCTVADSEPGCPSARYSVCPGSPFALDPQRQASLERLCRSPALTARCASPRGAVLRRRGWQRHSCSQATCVVK